jgi:hypothetical protein
MNFPSLKLTHSSNFPQAFHPLFNFYHSEFTHSSISIWFAKLGHFILPSALGSFLQHTYTLFASFDILAELCKIGQFMYPNMLMGTYTSLSVMAHPQDGFKF